MSDRRWKRWSAPLARWLDKGRTWEEIEAWCRARGDSVTITRHYIVWLEVDGQIEAVRVNVNTWLWRKVGAARYDHKADEGSSAEDEGNDPWLDALENG